MVICMKIKNEKLLYVIGYEYNDKGNSFFDEAFVLACSEEEAKELFLRYIKKHINSVKLFFVKKTKINVVTKQHGEG